MKILPKNAARPVPAVAGVVTGVAAALLLGGCSESAQSEDAPAAEYTLPVQAVEVGPRDLSRRVRMSAPVEPLRTTRLATRTDGVLAEVLVEEGDRIGAGDVLARLDVSEQQAELARADARHEEKRLTFERLQRLREQDYIDAASYEAARAELDVAASDVRLWRTRVEFGVVTAGTDATVIARHVEPGEAVNRHDVLFDLADLSTLVLRVGVSELDMRDLAEGDHVDVRLDAIGGAANPLAGTVRRVFPAAERNSRLVTVEIDLPDAAEHGVRPGFLARAELTVDQRDDVLAVPAGAVAEQDDGHYVMVIDADNRLQRRSVRIGAMRSGWQEITEGLDAGEFVVASNPLELSEGTRVRIVGMAG